MEVLYPKVQGIQYTKRINIAPQTCVINHIIVTDIALGTRESLYNAVEIIPFSYALHNVS